MEKPGIPSLLTYVRNWIHLWILVYKLSIYTTTHRERNSQVICLKKTKGALLSNCQFLAKRTRQQNQIPNNMIKGRCHWKTDRNSSHQDKTTNRSWPMYLLVINYVYIAFYLRGQHSSSISRQQRGVNVIFKKKIFKKVGFASSG